MKYLLGSNIDNELVFAEYHKYDDGRFGASFFTVRPFKEDDIDEVYVEDYLYSFGKDDLYDFCAEMDCSPNNLAEEVLNNWDIIDIVDCSLYNEWYTINGKDWYFKSGACGQHDTKNTMVQYTNERAYNLIYELWETYHLKPMDEDGERKLEEFTKLMDDVDEEEWITNYLTETFI